MAICNKFEMRCVFDRAVYAPGDQVQGLAVLTIPKVTGPIQSLTMTLKGSEFTSYKEPSFSGLRHIFNEKFLELDGASLVRGSTLSLPLSFTLPKGLPDSFMFEGPANKGFGRIFYEVSACLDLCTNDSYCWLTADELITVRNPLPQAASLAGPEADTQEHNIVSCCCIPRGLVECDVQVNKKAYSPGEFVEFEALLRPSKVKLVRRAKIEFVSCVQISSFWDIDQTAGYPESFETVIDTQEVKDLLVPIKMRFQVPAEALPTSMGTLVRRMHFIRVAVDTPSTFFTEFHIAVNVLPSKEADYSSIPGPLEQRMAQLVPGPYTPLPACAAKLPQRVVVNGQPLGRTINMHVPEYRF